MTLKETQEIITKWIESCQTSEQLDLLLEVMDKFVFERFANISPLIELEAAKSDLKDAWLVRKLLVVRKQY